MVERIRINQGLAIQIIVYIVALTLAYAALDKRIARLEDRDARVATDLQEIKADVKILLRRQP